MNKILSSPIIKIVALVAGLYMAVSIAQFASDSYRYYLEINLNYWASLPLGVSILIFGACLTLFFISVWKSPKKSEIKDIRRIDWSLLAVLIFFLVYLCSAFLLDGRFFFITFQLLLTSIAVYLAVVLYLGEIVARARDGHLIKTLYWVRFFKLYPVTRPPGFLMAAVLLWDILIILYVCLLHFVNLWYALAPLSLAVFTLIVLSWFCSFLLSLSEEYNRANAEKLKAERFKAELITNVSHDIRTPLTAVINYTDLLKALPVDNPEFSEYVNVLDKKALRLKTLIDDLMEASKAGTGNLSLDISEIDLCEIAGQVAGEFDDQFEERGLALVFRQPEGPVQVLTDKRHLWRALENLFGNAAKYALEGTRVFVEISEKENGWSFSLKNISQSPIDMPPGSLTEQFIRGDLARQSEGNGLGLYIAKSLVEAMGGQFGISVSGDLFEVEIRLPAPFSQD